MLGYRTDQIIPKNIVNLWRGHIPPLFTPKTLILRIQLPTGYNQFNVCSPIFIKVSLIKTLVLIFLFVPLKWNGIIFNTAEIEEKSLNEFVSTRDVRKWMFYGIRS